MRTYTTEVEFHKTLLYLEKYGDNQLHKKNYIPWGPEVKFSKIFVSA
jgi:hypothetical protein